MAYPVVGAATQFAGTTTNAADYRNLFKVAYANMVRLKIQQEFSNLQDTCQQEPIMGDGLNIDLYKNVTLQTRFMNQRLGGETGNANYAQTLTERRPLKPTFKEYPELFDRRHERAWMRALRPDSQYARNVMAAYNNYKDATIITALDAVVTQTGASDVTTESVASGSGGNYVWYNDPRVTGTNTGLDINKILLASRLLNTAGGVGGRRYAVTDPFGLDDLLSQSTITSADYNSVKALVSGELNTWMGFSWRVNNQVGTRGLKGTSTIKASSGGTASTNGTQAYFYTDNTMVYGQTPMYIRFSEEGSFGFNLQAYHDLGVGAVRLDEGSMVVVQYGPTDFA
jgi:hypothetical protein